MHCYRSAWRTQADNIDRRWPAIVGQKGETEGCGRHVPLVRCKGETTPVSRTFEVPSIRDQLVLGTGPLEDGVRRLHDALIANGPANRSGTIGNSRIENIDISARHISDIPTVLGGSVHTESGVGDGGVVGGTKAAFAPRHRDVILQYDFRTRAVELGPGISLETGDLVAVLCMEEPQYFA